MSFKDATEYMLKYQEEKREAAINNRKTRWFADGVDTYDTLVNTTLSSKTENNDLIAGRATHTKDDKLMVMGEKLSHVATLRAAVRTQFAAGADVRANGAHDVTRYVAAFASSAEYQLRLLMQAVAIRLTESTNA